MGKLRFKPFFRTVSIALFISAPSAASPVSGTPHLGLEIVGMRELPAAIPSLNGPTQILAPTLDYARIVGKGAPEMIIPAASPSAASLGMGVRPRAAVQRERAAGPVAAAAAAADPNAAFDGSLPGGNVELNDFILAGGAKMIAPLGRGELKSLAKRPKFLMTDDRKGHPKRGPFQKWFPEGSGLHIYEKWMEVEKRVRALDKARRDKTQPLVIMDWGTANARFLKEFPAALKEWGIPNVILIGTSHQYYPTWQSLPDGTVVLFGRMEHYIDALRRLGVKIDLVLSHFALFEIGLSQSKRKLTHHLTELAPFLKPSSEIVFTGSIAKETEGARPRQLLREAGFDMKIRHSRHLKTTARPKLRAVRAEKLTTPERYEYTVLTRRFVPARRRTKGKGHLQHASHGDPYR